MTTARETGSTPTFGRRESVAVGALACVGALLSTPAVNAVAPLHFVGGLVISVVLPGVFGAVALASGVRLYRLDATRLGVGIAVGSLLATLVGVLFGVAAVF